MDALPCYEFTLDADGELLMTDVVQKAFKQCGFIIIRRGLSEVEATHLKKAVEEDSNLVDNCYGRQNGEGGVSHSVLWNNLSDDYIGALAKCEKIAGTMEKLLGGEVYHYHGKVIMKNAHSGGAHTWHQDYGYWYANGCLFPDMGTVWIAVDRADERNGCLKVVPGSHLCGRINHIRAGDQARAEDNRVEELTKRLGVKQIVMDPGDVLMFHSNILHRSDKNDSSSRRWAYLIAYNCKSNNPVYKHHHPFYFPLQKIDNSELKEHFHEIGGYKDFFGGPNVDYSITNLGEMDRK